ncbi:hypothetical protein SUGI_1140900 [Cryptomeria japonica]|uniref:MADS-box transcription factor 1-like n=1 Tax=Cryptomeria japonica TaxID=3369 RepID=UPI0024146E38|nr:MADS-box transcription factor 1-like [Cryptomeria japonica]GLJ53483.1 hypothetical protein SUGI_1140900 [Cryptomeria japonica]
MGRRKLLPIYIADQSRRRQTFLKRKKGLFKKARELSVLCGGKVFMRIHDPENAQDFSQEEFDGSSFLQPQHNAVALPLQMDQFAPDNFNGVNPTISNCVPVQGQMDQFADWNSMDLIQQFLPQDLQPQHNAIALPLQMDQFAPDNFNGVNPTISNSVPVQAQMDQRHPQFVMSEQAKAKTNLSSSGEMQNDEDPSTPSTLPLVRNCTSQQEDDALPLLQPFNISSMLELLQEDVDPHEMMFEDLRFPYIDLWGPQ